MGAMTRLNLSDNGIGGHNDEPGVHALADMLKSNTTLKEFNISSNSLDKECAQILAPALRDNGALQCTDGTPYQSEKSFMMSTHVCRHCGQHNTQHKSR
jgi:hypothetical protein